MEVEFLGQACTLARAPGGVAVLTDPWFSGPAHLGAWRSVPTLDAAGLAEMRARVAGATHIYVSHAHEDHFDPTFLRTLPRATLLVGAFRSTLFRAALEALRDVHAIRWCADGEAVALAPGVRATIHLEKPLHRTNSMLLIESEGGSYLDANDCGVSSAMLSAIAAKRRPTLFAYTLNYAANGYPFPYLRGTLAERRARIHAVRDEIVGGFRTALGILRPALACAFAGPVTFSDAESAFLDEDPEALDWSAMVRELDGEVPVRWPAPGSRFVLRGDAVHSEDVHTWPAAAPVERCDPRVDPVLSAAQPSERVLVAAASRLAERLGEILRGMPGRSISTTLVLSAAASLATLEDEPALRIAVRPGEGARLLRKDEPLGTPRLEITSLASVLVGFCDGDVDLDTLLLSLRARFSREPDTFDPLLHDLLRFGHDPGCVEAMLEAEADRAHSREHGCATRETITIEHEGRTLRIPRHCPHEGELLERARIDADGRLVCPRHRWKFDLRTGQCVRGDRRVNLFALAKEADE